MQAFMISNEFISSINTPEHTPNPSFWLIFQGNKVLVFQDEDGRYALPQINDGTELGLPLLRQHYLGRFSERVEEDQSEIFRFEGFQLAVNG